MSSKTHILYHALAGAMLGGSLGLSFHIFLQTIHSRSVFNTLLQRDIALEILTGETAYGYCNLWVFGMLFGMILGTHLATSELIRSGSPLQVASRWTESLGTWSGITSFALVFVLTCWLGNRRSTMSWRLRWHTQLNEYVFDLAVACFAALGLGLARHGWLKALFLLLALYSLWRLSDSFYFPWPKPWDDA